MQEEGAFFGGGARAQRIKVVFGELFRTLSGLGLDAGPVLLTADAEAWKDAQGSTMEPLLPLRSFCLCALLLVPLLAPPCPDARCTGCAACLSRANSGGHGTTLEWSLRSAGSVLNLECALGPDEPPYSLMLRKVRDRHELAAMHAAAASQWRIVGAHSHTAGGPLIRLPQQGDDADDA